jgi:hypothetical protein
MEMILLFLPHDDPLQHNKEADRISIGGSLQPTPTHNKNRMNAKKIFRENRERMLQSLANGVEPRNIFRQLKEEGHLVYWSSFWSYMRGESLFDPYLPPRK